MKALVYSGPERFEVVELPTPAVGSNQVLIKVEACGVCKTDVHIHHGRFITAFPLTPGHEFAGRVSAVGEGVTEFRPGDRVTADNAVPCGDCYYCRRNMPLYCENFYSLGCNGPGGFAEYVLAGRDKVFRLPDRLSYEEAVFTEPTACVMHCVDRVNMRPGDEVLLLGAGPAGLILAQLLMRSGASEVVVAAPTESKLDLARSLGIEHTVVIERSNPAASTDRLLERHPKGYDVVVDATGSVAVCEQCPPLAKYGGKVVIFGVPDEDDRMAVSPYDVYRREISIIGSFAQTHCFDRALDYLANGGVEVAPLITHTFPLMEYGKALSVLMTDRRALKIIIKP